MNRRRFLSLALLGTIIGGLSLKSKTPSRWEALPLHQKKLVLSRWKNFKSLPEAKKVKIIAAFQSYREKRALC